MPIDALRSVYGARFGPADQLRANSATRDMEYGGRVRPAPSSLRTTAGSAPNSSVRNSPLFRPSQVPGPEPEPDSVERDAGLAPTTRNDYNRL